MSLKDFSVWIAKSKWIAAVFVFVITFVVFSPSLNLGFLFFDDPLYVLMSPVTRGGLRWSGLVSAFTDPLAGNYHPLVWPSLMLDQSIGEVIGQNPGVPDPRIYHLTNVLLHTANATLVFLLIRTFSKNVWISLAVALAFSLHPQRVESVAWVSGRKDLLFGLFSILAIGAYAAWARSRTIGRFSLTTAAVLAAMLSKPMAVTLPLLFLCVDIWPLGRMTSLRETIRLVWEKVPWLLLSLFTSWMTILAHSSQVRTATLSVISIQDRLAALFTGYAHYLRLWIFPSELAIVYPLPSSWNTAEVLFSVLLFAAITVLAMVTWKRMPWLAAGWFFFVLNILPVSGIMQTGGQAYADRYTYLASLGLATALFLSVREWAGAPVFRSIRIGACIALLGGWSFLTSRYLEEWTSTERLFTTTYFRTWQNGPAARVLCAVYLRQQNYFLAAVWMRSYLGRYPGDVDMWNDLGVALAETKRFDEARKAFEQALRLNPGKDNVRQNLELLPKPAAPEKP